jgi:hypothetical protein
MLSTISFACRIARGYELAPLYEGLAEFRRCLLLESRTLPLEIVGRYVDLVVGFFEVCSSRKLFENKNRLTQRNRNSHFVRAITAC